MSTKYTPWTRALPALPAAALLTGCSRSPSFNVLGSYFPSWLVCAVLGILLAALLGFFLRRRNLEERIAGLPIFYISVALAIACVIWLICFE